MSEEFSPDHIHTTPVGRHFRHGDGVEVDGEGDEFICPQCGGRYFGRDTAKVNGRVEVLETVGCHDEFQIGCKWRGVWPVPDLTNERK